MRTETRELMDGISEVRTYDSNNKLVEIRKVYAPRTLVQGIRVVKLGTIKD